MSRVFGHCPNGGEGGVSTLARMVWGTFLEKNFPSSNGHLLDFRGGLNPCQDGLGHNIFRDELPSSNCKIRPKKSAPECPFECGGGVQKLFGQCPNRACDFFKGASLRGSFIQIYMTLPEFTWIYII